MDFINLIIYFAIGIAPCIIWLLFYLKQDAHPESNKKIIEIFFLGAFMVIPALILEEFLGGFFPPENIISQNFLLLLLYYFIVIGVVEEFFKYLPIKLRIINSSHFDEPIDAMLYLIIAGLGFAAVENIAVIFSFTENFTEATFLSFVRLLTAVFLHTLASAIIGYFFVLSLFKKNKKIFYIGFLFSSLLHGLYDVYMVKLEKAESIFHFLLPIGIIFLMTILVYFFLLKVKKMPRKCE